MPVPSVTPPYLNLSEKVANPVIVVLAPTVKSPLIVVVPPTAEPIFTVVVEPVVPLVPMLTVFVNAPAKAAVERFVVELAPVPVYPCVNEVALAHAPNVAPLSTDVVNVGDVERTIFVVPVTALLRATPP